jgi:hypothetical protein
MMQPTATPDAVSCAAWLAECDISRPHRTGRWRVRRADTGTTDPRMAGMILGRALAQSEIDHLACWRDSEEFRHKANAAGFLHFAKYRHAVDGAGNSQMVRTKAMCRHIRVAMTLFGAGDLSAGEAAMQLAWAEYMLLLTISSARNAVAGAQYTAGHRQRTEKSAASRRQKSDPLAPIFEEAWCELSTTKATVDRRSLSDKAWKIAEKKHPEWRDLFTEHRARAWLKANKPTRT